MRSVVLFIIYLGRNDETDSIKHECAPASYICAYTVVGMKAGENRWLLSGRLCKRALCTLVDISVSGTVLRKSYCFNGGKNYYRLKHSECSFFI